MSEGFSTLLVMAPCGPVAIVTERSQEVPAELRWDLTTMREPVRTQDVLDVTTDYYARTAKAIKEVLVTPSAYRRLAIEAGAFPHIEAEQDFDTGWQTYTMEPGVNEIRLKHGLPHAPDVVRVMVARPDGPKGEFASVMEVPQGDDRIRIFRDVIDITRLPDAANVSADGEFRCRVVARLVSQHARLRREPAQEKIGQQTPFMLAIEEID